MELSSGICCSAPYIVFWGETCNPHWIRLATTNYQIFSSIALAFCALRKPLNSSEEIPATTTIVRKRNLLHSVSWSWILFVDCFWSHSLCLFCYVWAFSIRLHQWWHLPCPIDKHFGYINWNNPSQIHLIWDRDKTCYAIKRVIGLWSIMTVTLPRQPSK